MKAHFFVCDCYSNEHTLRFGLDLEDTEDVYLYTSVFLNQYRGLFKRIWVATKYVFNYTCKYGHWDRFELRKQDADRLIVYLQKYVKAKEE